jgi:hypothetical protein
MRSLFMGFAYQDVDGMDDLCPVIPPLHIAGLDPRVQSFNRALWGIGAVSLDHRLSNAPNLCIGKCE